MSTRTRKTEKKRSASERKASAPEMENGALAFYVYCIGESHTLAPLLEDSLPLAIETDARLELIEDKDLAAVVSTVSLEDYGEQALEAHLSDATWTAIRAMRHERVVDHFARRTSVVPLRFGTVYIKRSGVEKMLGERRERLRAAIDSLRGREEWGVNVFCDRKALMEGIASLSPRLRELNEQAASSSPGQAYLVRKKMDSMRADEARAETKRVVTHIEHELQAESEGTTRLRILPDETGALEGEMVGKLAVLIDRARFDRFRRRAERLAEEHARTGFRLELTGPWPAYNFVTGESA